MKKLVKIVGLTLIFTLVASAVFNMVLEYARYKAFKKSYYLICNLAMSNAANNAQSLKEGHKFKYTSAEFIDYLNYVLSTTVDYNDLNNLSWNSYEGRYLKYYGVTPAAFGAMFLPTDVMTENIKTSLEKIIGLKTGTFKRGTVSSVGSYTQGKLPNIDIINNGVFEIDMGSIRVDIEYQVCDKNSAFVRSYVLNANNLDIYATGGGSQKDIIVSRVTLNMLVCVPYVTKFSQNIYNSYGRVYPLEITNYYWMS